MTDGLVFGVFVPQGGKSEPGGTAGARSRWAKTVESAGLTEDLGYDGVWVVDDDEFEGWTTLAALSQCTARLRLGHVAAPSRPRRPSVLAKIASTVDLLSGGRLDVGFGAWYPEAGVPQAGLPEAGVSEAASDALEEAVVIVRALWTQPETTYTGRHFSTLAAPCDPKPLQQPHPPVWIGSGGDDDTLRVVARQADFATFGGNRAQWKRTAEGLQRQCREVGRDYDAIAKTWSAELLVRETEAEAERAAARPLSRGGSFALWRDANLVGTPPQVVEKLERYRANGCRGVVVRCADDSSDESLRRFATEVMPHFR